MSAVDEQTAEARLVAYGGMLSATATMLLASGQPSARLLGLGLSAVGDFLSSSASSIIQNNQNKPLNEIVGTISADLVGSYAGAQVGLQVGIAISGYLLLGVLDAALIANFPLAVALVVAMLAIDLGFTFIGSDLLAPWRRRPP